MTTFATLKAQYEASSLRCAAHATPTAFALRDAADFLDHAAEMIACGVGVGDPEVVKRVTWARWKVIEAGF
jgi:hypothetical protein